MRILVTGENGLLARSIKKVSKDIKNSNSWFFAGRDKVDLRKSDEVLNLIIGTKPEIVVHAAAVVGGLQFNLLNSEKILRENILIDSHIFNACLELKVTKLFYFGSSCMYSPNAALPFETESIGSLEFEKSNENYALAKYVGAKAIESIREKYQFSYFNAILSNLYGNYDNFTDDSSHVLSAAFRKIYLAKKFDKKQVIAWGSGKPLREFTYSEDVAKWIVNSLDLVDSLPAKLNLGSGEETSIKQIYQVIANSFDYQGEIIFDSTFPDGIARKVMNSDLARQHYNWEPETSLTHGIESMKASLLRGEISIV